MNWVHGPGETPGPFFIGGASGNGAGQREMSFFFSRGDEAPVDLTAETEALYRETAEELIRVVNAIRAGEFQAIGAAKGAVRDLRAVFQLVMDERNKVEKLRKQVAGAIGSGTLDLSAARDEIGRRLARLRDAG